MARADMIYNELLDLPEDCVIVDPMDPSHHRQHGSDSEFDDLLVPVIEKGKLIGALPTLPEIQARTRQQLNMFHASIMRLDNPHKYPVGLEQQLHEQKTALVRSLRG